MCFQCFAHDARSLDCGIIDFFSPFLSVAAVVCVCVHIVSAWQMSEAPGVYENSKRDANRIHNTFLR